MTNDNNEMPENKAVKLVTNIIKLQPRLEDTEKEPKKNKREKKPPIASVFLQERDIGLRLHKANYTEILKPRAAYELALLLLAAIKAGADKYLPKDSD